MLCLFFSTWSSWSWKLRQIMWSLVYWSHHIYIVSTDVLNSVKLNCLVFSLLAQVIDCSITLLLLTGYHHMLFCTAEKMLVHMYLYLLWWDVLADHAQSSYLQYLDHNCSYCTHNLFGLRNSCGCMCFWIWNTECRCCVTNCRLWCLYTYVLQTVIDSMCVRVWCVRVCVHACVQLVLSAFDAL